MVDFINNDYILNKKNDIFKKRRFTQWMLIFSFIFIYFISAIVSGFQNIFAFGTIPEGIWWLFKNFFPNSDSIKIFPKILNTSIKTLCFAMTATTISSIFALFLAILGSQRTGKSKIIQIAIKIIALIFRDIPLISWSMVLLLSFGQSEMTGMFALVLVTFGYLTRVFTETIDEVSQDILDALYSTGANYTQVIFQGVLPNAAPKLISWLLYFIENSIREITLIGVLTGTGIGYMFNFYYRDFNYNVAGLIILVIVVLVITIELFSNKVRKELL